MDLLIVGLLEVSEICCSDCWVGEVELFVGWAIGCEVLSLFVFGEEESVCILIEGFI